MRSHDATRFPRSPRRRVAARSRPASATAKDGRAYYTTYDGESWDEWYDLGENYAYEVSSYEYGDGYYLTYTGENGYQYYKEYEYAAGEEEDDGY